MEPLKMRASTQSEGVILYYLRRNEGTGTRPDYLVNRGPKKLRGHSGEKIAQKSRNNCTVHGRGCGCIGTVSSRRNFSLY